MVVFGHAAFVRKHPFEDEVPKGLMMMMMMIVIAARFVVMVIVVVAHFVVVMVGVALGRRRQRVDECN